MKKLLWSILISLASAELYAGPIEQLEAFIKTDRHDMVVELITKKKVNVNCTLRGGLSPLDWALTVGNQETINFLIEHGAQATGEDLSSYDKGVYVPKTTRTQQTRRAVQSAKCVQRQHLQQSEDLRAAVLSDNVSEVMACIGAGASLEGGQGQKLLRLAINTNKFQIIAWLMDQGVTLATETLPQPPQAANSSEAQQPANVPSSSAQPPAGPSDYWAIASFPLIGTMDADDLQSIAPFAETMAEETLLDDATQTPITYERPVYKEINPRASQQIRYQARLHNTLLVFEEILESTEARIRGEQIPSDAAERIRARAKQEVVERIQTIAQREPQEARDLYSKAISTSKINVIAAFREAGFPLHRQHNTQQRYTARRKRRSVKPDFDTFSTTSKKMKDA